MNRPLVIWVVALALVAGSGRAFGQGGQPTVSLKDFARPGAELPEVTPGPGWKSCPRCQNPGQEKAALDRFVASKPSFNPRDITGVWGNNGIRLDFSKLPPMTPNGRKLWEATQANANPREPTGGTNGGPGSKDPMLRCDPLGYPRLATYNYGTEFAQLPNRVVQFFEWGHTWRDIWTDGRPLPTAPPENRFLGYSVGRWEGNTFVIESMGFEPLPWIDQDRRTGEMTRGIPHSEAMRITERWTRTSATTMDIEINIVDPEVFEGPWTSRATETLKPSTELGEYFCVPSFSDFYNTRVIDGQAR